MSGTTGGGRIALVFVRHQVDGINGPETALTSISRKERGESQCLGEWQADRCSSGSVRLKAFDIPRKSRGILRSFGP